MISDPLDARPPAYELLGIQASASRKDIDLGLMRRLRERARNGGELRQAREQLSRTRTRLQYDLLLYELDGGPVAALKEIPAPEVPRPQAPISSVPIAELVAPELVPVRLPVPSDRAEPPESLREVPDLLLPLGFDA